MLIEQTATMICGMSPPEEVRHSLIRQLIDGRNLEENFRLVFERYHHAVSGFFFRQGLSPEDRRDLTQEVFVNVYQAIKNLQSEAAFVPWLFSIANHVALRHWERQRARPKLQTFFSDREDDEPRPRIRIRKAAFSIWKGPGPFSKPWKTCPTRCKGA